MNVVIGTRGQPKKFDVPHSSQEKADDDDASGTALFKFWRSEKLTDREEVGDARNRQRGHEVRPASIVEVA
jgi:hypothetical protein